MLSYSYTALFIVAGLTCRASAFSTLFMNEGAEARKMEDEEIKTPKMEENRTSEEFLIPQTVEVKILPIANVVTQTSDDLMTLLGSGSLSPLKIATAIVAQHLLTSLKNIPLPESMNSSQATMNMIESLADEIVKVSEVVKFTATYASEAAQYILSSLKNQTMKAEDAESVKKQFYTMIARHILETLNELDQKKELTGKAILSSSSYHIVNAFQDMLNTALALQNKTGEDTSTDKKFNEDLTVENTAKVVPEVTPSSDIHTSIPHMMANNHPVPSIQITPSFVSIPTPSRNEPTQEKAFIDNNLTIEVIPEQGKKHKSIKKDQAVPEDKRILDILNQDLSAEVFSPETVLQDKKAEENTVDKTKGALTIEVDPLETKELFHTNNQLHKTLYKGQDKLKKSFEKEIKLPKHFDKELASSQVDSLSNVPQESEVKRYEYNFKDGNLVKTTKQSPDLKNVLELMTAKSDAAKQECEETVQPVCAIDQKNNKFIVFLNNCKRLKHNKMFGVDFEEAPMATCVTLFMQDPAVHKPSIVDLRPR